MRWSVVSFLVSGLLLSSLSATAAPHRHRTPADEAKGIAVKVDVDAGAEVTRPSKPIQLPSGYYERYESPPPVTYYEGENCSGQTYDAVGGDDTVIYAGDDDDDDDDTVTGDDDDDTTTVTGDDDDDDDDDDDSADDDDDDTVTTLSVRKTAMRTPVQHHSPVSRLALVGVLLAFPLRRRGMLAGHARRRHGGQ